MVYREYGKKCPDGPVGFSFPPGKTLSAKLDTECPKEK